MFERLPRGAFFLLSGPHIPTAAAKKCSLPSHATHPSPAVATAMPSFLFIPTDLRVRSSPASGKVVTCVPKLVLLWRLVVLWVAVCFSTTPPGMLNVNGILRKQSWFLYWPAAPLTHCTCRTPPHTLAHPHASSPMPHTHSSASAPSVPTN